MAASDHAQQRPQRFPLREGARPQMQSGHPKSGAPPEGQAARSIALLRMSERFASLSRMPNYATDADFRVQL